MIPRTEPTTEANARVAAARPATKSGMRVKCIKSPGPEMAAAESGLGFDQPDSRGRLSPHEPKSIRELDQALETQGGARVDCDVKISERSVGAFDPAMRASILPATI